MDLACDINNSIMVRVITDNPDPMLLGSAGLQSNLRIQGIHRIY